MKTNLVIIGWDEKATKNLAKQISTSFDKIYADVEDLLEYYLTDSQTNIKQLCGVEYLDELKSKIMKEISNYDNAVIYLPLYLFVSQDNWKVLSKNAFIIFIDIKDCLIKDMYVSDPLPQQQIALKTLTLRNRIDFCRLKCDCKITCNVADFNKSYKTISQTIKKYLSQK